MVGGAGGYKRLLSARGFLLFISTLLFWYIQNQEKWSLCSVLLLSKNRIKVPDVPIPSLPPAL
jgi:hypothetical protein